jgi:hypothetical protein
LIHLHCTTFSACHSSRRILFAHFRQFSSSELFSRFLTFLLTGNSYSGLHSIFFHFKLHILHTLHIFLLSTSLHSVAQAAHDNLFRQQVFQQHLFRQKVLQQPLLDIKIISNHFFISATTIFPLQRQLSIIKTSQPSSPSFLVFLFNKFIFSTKHEVSALSGYVLNIHHFSKPSLTLKRFKFRFSGESRAFVQHINIITSTSSTFFISQLNCSGKNVQLSIINIFATCLNSQQKHQQQITALKRESSPPLFLLSTTPAKSFHHFSSPTLRILIATKNHSPFFSGLLSPLSSFCARTFFT